MNAAKEWVVLAAVFRTEGKTVMQEKRMLDSFHWIPLHLRKGRFGFPLSQKVDYRKPIYWTTSHPVEKGRELYFVNDSDETLEFVKAEDGGFTSVDDGAVSVWTKEGKGFLYRDVLPREAVKVAEFDDYYDLDYLLAVSVIIKSPVRGVVKLSTPLEKGGTKECVLLYD